MTHMFRILFIAFFGCSVLVAQKTTPDSPDYKIILTTKKLEYSLGEPIVVTVRYYNGSKNAWQLFRPDSSFYNSINYRNILWRTEDRWNGHAFNKSQFININENYPESGFAVALTGGKIQLQPNEDYSFKTDIMEGYELSYVLPGNYEVMFFDSFEAKRSDTIKICLKFTSESVRYIIERLKDEKRNSSNIRWAIMLLSDIYSDMKKFKFTSQDNAITYSKEQQVDNQQLLNDFQACWQQNKNTEEMKAKIHRINTDLKKYSFIDMRRTKLIKDGCIVY